jgi:hypothetical protein
LSQARRVMQEAVASHPETEALSHSPSNARSMQARASWTSSVLCSSEVYWYHITVPLLMHLHCRAIVRQYAWCLCLCLGLVAPCSIHACSVPSALRICICGIGRP